MRYVYSIYMTYVCVCIHPILEGEAAFWQLVARNDTHTYAYNTYAYTNTYISILVMSFLVKKFVEYVCVS